MVRLLKIVVFGGRHYDGALVVFEALEHLHARFAIDCLMHGKATGADQFGAAWAAARRIKVVPYPADWKKITTPGAVIKYNKYGLPYNAMAGFDRNLVMAADNPDLGVQFPGGRGTAHMRRCLDVARVSVVQVYKHSFHKHMFQKQSDQIDLWLAESP